MGNNTSCFDTWTNSKVSHKKAPNHSLTQHIMHCSSLNENEILIIYASNSTEYATAKQFYTFNSLDNQWILIYKYIAKGYMSSMPRLIPPQYYDPLISHNKAKNELYIFDLHGMDNGDCNENVIIVDIKTKQITKKSININYNVKTNTTQCLTTMTVNNKLHFINYEDKLNYKHLVFDANTQTLEEKCRFHVNADTNSNNLNYNHCCKSLIYVESRNILLLFGDRYNETCWFPEIWCYSIKMQTWTLWNIGTNLNQFIFSNKCVLTKNEQYVVMIGIKQKVRKYWKHAYKYEDILIFDLNVMRIRQSVVKYPNLGHFSHIAITWDDNKRDLLISGYIQNCWQTLQMDQYILPAEIIECISLFYSNEMLHIFSKGFNIRCTHRKINIDTILECEL
eukprot:233516_1